MKYAEKTADRATFQPLEARRMMAAAALATSTIAYNGGMMLTVAGTAGADNITLSYNGTGYTIATAAGFTKTVAGQFTAVKITAAAGNDRVTVDAGVTVPTFLYGGDGNDTLTGGSGDDSLYAGGGANFLYGMNGRDTLITLGTTTDGLTGGGGEDFFWTDNKPGEIIYDADAYEIAHAVNKITAFTTSKFVTGTVKTQAVPLTLAAQRFRDPDVSTKTYVYKKFENRPLFANAGPTADDIRQGQVGDCYFLSTLAGTAAVTPDVIRTMMTDLGDGTYAVRFKTAAGATQFYRVDNDLAVYNSTSTTPAYAALGQGGSMWVAIAEKAYAYARRSQGTYNSISGGWMTDVFTALGTGNQLTKWGTSAASADDYLNWVQQRLTDGYVVTLAVMNSNDTLNLIGGHAYTVTRIDTLPDGTRQLVIRNPWGIDGYQTNDGNSDGYVRLTAAGALAGIDAFVAAKAA